MNIKQEDLFFLNEEKLNIKIGKKTFKINQIKLIELTNFQLYIEFVLSTLQEITNLDWFYDRDAEKINEKVLLKYSANRVLLRAAYELLKKQSFERKFYYELFDLNENDNIITAVLKWPLKLLYKFLNYIHIKIFFKLSYNYFLKNILPENFLAIWYGTLLINVEGIKKKVEKISTDYKAYFQVRQLSLTTLFQGHQTKQVKRYIAKVNPATGIIGKYDTIKSIFV